MVVTRKSILALLSYIFVILFIILFCQFVASESESESGSNDYNELPPPGRMGSSTGCEGASNTVYIELNPAYLSGCEGCSENWQSPDSTEGCPNYNFIWKENVLPSDLTCSENTWMTQQACCADVSCETSFEVNDCNECDSRCDDFVTSFSCTTKCEDKDSDGDLDCTVKKVYKGYKDESDLNGEGEFKFNVPQSCSVPASVSIVGYTCNDKCTLFLNEEGGPDPNSAQIGNSLSFSGEPVFPNEEDYKSGNVQVGENTLKLKVENTIGTCAGATVLLKFVGFDGGTTWDTTKFPQARVYCVGNCDVSHWVPGADPIEGDPQCSSYGLISRETLKNKWLRSKYASMIPHCEPEFERALDDAGAYVGEKYPEIKGKCVNPDSDWRLRDWMGWCEKCGSMASEGASNSEECSESEFEGVENQFCSSGTCDIIAKKYCESNQWLTLDKTNYCDFCAEEDPDFCGICSGKIDFCMVEENIYCDEDGDPINEDGNRITEYCQNCNINDSVDCCIPDWFCSEWDSSCDGVNDLRSCLEWFDRMDCGSDIVPPSEDLEQTCWFAFNCTLDDDNDSDGFPFRSCFDADGLFGDSGVVFENIDYDDNNPAVNPGSSELCNGIDDDCDGTIDEDVCPCTSGEIQICGRSEGICRQGVQVCNLGVWSVCGGPGYVGPEREICGDGLDNNCDGFIDENCNCEEGEVKECGTDVGLCEKGTQVCYNGSFGSVCNNEVKPSTEVCDNGIDDDCDGFVDGDDSNCQISNPVTKSEASCFNRKQDGDEEGPDCGGSCPRKCYEELKYCGYGEIKEKCLCGKVAYRNGYCCNQKFSIVPCVEPPKDSDNDGCNDDQEAQMGTNPFNSDTDGDGFLDCDANELSPLCNEDGVCDITREYAETKENCASDCGKEKEIGGFLIIFLIIIILALLSFGIYYLKRKGLIDKSKKQKKEEFNKFTFSKEDINRSLKRGLSGGRVSSSLKRDIRSSLIKKPLRQGVKKNVFVGGQKGNGSDKNKKIKY